MRLRAWAGGVVVLGAANAAAMWATQAAPTIPVGGVAPRAELDSGSGARISLREDHLRFGDKFEDEQLTLSLYIRNVGSDPLVIRSISPGCGCAAVRGPAEAIPPGGESPGIPIDIKLHGMGGPYSKTGFIASNDPTASRIPFYMEGEVHRRIDVEPSSMTLKPAARGGAITGSLRVTRLDGEALTEVVVECPIADLVTETRRSPGPTGSVDILLRADHVLEQVRTGITVKAAGVQRVVPLVLAPWRDVECDPSTLSTGLTLRGATHSIALVSRQVGWSVREVTTSRKDLVAAVRGSEIEVRWGEDAPDGVVSGEIEVTFNGATPERICVPVTSFLHRTQKNG